MAAAVLCNVSTFKKPAQHVSLLDSCKLAISLRDLSMNKANARAPSIDVHSQTLYGVCIFRRETHKMKRIQIWMALLHCVAIIIDRSYFMFTSNVDR